MKIRNGMWVVVEDKVGITSFNNGIIEVHFVNEIGETISVRNDIPAAEMRQATLIEIPEARRPTEEAGSPLGYV